MSRTASNFRIGLFVGIGAALLAAGVVLFGAGDFFRTKALVETYIDESVQGLDVGSSVRYRGVKIGTVTDIDFVHNVYRIQDTPAQMPQYVLVRFKIYPDVLGAEPQEDLQPFFYKGIQRGLRVRLGMQGVTGSLYVDIDFIDPERQAEPFQPPWTPKGYYIPWAPSTITRLGDSVDRILTTLENTKIDEVADDLSTFLQTLLERVEGGLFQELSDSAVDLIAELRETNRSLQEKLASKDLEALLREGARGAENFSALAASAREDFEGVGEDLSVAARRVADLSARLEAFAASPRTSETLRSFARTAEHLERFSSDDLQEAGAQMRATLQRLDRAIAAQQDNIDSVMRNLKSASQDVRGIVDEGREYPSHIFFGEPPPRVEIESDID